MAILYKQVSKHSYRKIKPKTLEELKNYFECDVYPDGLEKVLNKHKDVYCHYRPTMEDDDEPIIDWFISEEDATDSYFTIIENF